MNEEVHKQYLVTETGKKKFELSTVIINMSSYYFNSEVEN